MLFFNGVDRQFYRETAVRQAFHAPDGTSLLTISHAFGGLRSQSLPLKMPTQRRFDHRISQWSRLQVPLIRKPKNKKPPSWVVLVFGAADGTSLLTIRHAFGGLRSQSLPLKTPTLRRFPRRETRRSRLQVPLKHRPTKNDHPVRWSFFLGAADGT